MTPPARQGQADGERMSLLTPQELADRLKKCRKTAYNIINRGLLTPIRIEGVRGILVDEEELNRLIEESKCPPSKTQKASGKSSLAKGDDEYIAFCRKGRREPKRSKKKPTCDVKYLIRTS